MRPRRTLRRPPSAPAWTSFEMLRQKRLDLRERGGGRLALVAPRRPAPVARLVPVLHVGKHLEGVVRVVQGSRVPRCCPPPALPPLSSRAVPLLLAGRGQ